MADMSQMQSRIRELEARRAKGESVPELDRLYEKMDSMQNKGYTEAKKNLSGENLVRPKRTPLEEAAMREKAGEERARLRKDKTARLESIDEMVGAGREALDEQRRETRFKVPELEERAKTAYKKGGKVSSASKRADGCATKGKTKGKML